MQFILVAFLFTPLALMLVLRRILLLPAFVNMSFGINLYFLLTVLSTLIYEVIHVTERKFMFVYKFFVWLSG